MRHKLTIAEQQGVSVATLQREGRLLGYDVVPERDSGRGPVLVDNDLVEYRSARDALAEYRRVVLRDYRSVRGYGHLRLTHPTPGTSLISYLCLCTFYREIVATLYATKGPYFFWIEENAVTGTVSSRRIVATLLRDASLIKRRMPASPLPLPTSLNLPPGAIPGPTPTPLPESQPFMAITCSYVNQPSAVGVGVYDTAHGARVCIQTRTNDGSRNFSGYLSASGAAPPSGDMFLYPWVSERKIGGTAPFVSSVRNFRVRGRDGRVFAAQVGTPYGLGGSALRTMRMVPGPQINSGCVMAVVPEHDGPYTVLWDEGGAIPFTPVATLAVFPSH